VSLSCAGPEANVAHEIITMIDSRHNIFIIYILVKNRQVSTMGQGVKGMGHRAWGKELRANGKERRA
jgi:hypothetical protein